MNFPEDVDSTRVPDAAGSAPASVGLEDVAWSGDAQTADCAAPAEYGVTWRDAARARALSVIRDTNLHYVLYGHAQGRGYLGRLAVRPRRVVLISPSHGKQCGIGEYGRYLAEQFAAMGLEVTVHRTSAAALALPTDALDGALVLVNHGPGLFDGLNARLSQGESTGVLIHNLQHLVRDRRAIVVVLHHSLLDADHELLFSRQAQILAAPITQVSFVSSGARHFFMAALELGISPVPAPDHVYDVDRNGRPEKVGFFGFFQYGGKDFEALIHLARELRAVLIGSVATIGQFDVDKLDETLKNSGIEHNISSGWLPDVDLMDSLIESDYFYIPQKDYDHWNNSATARFVCQLDRPLFLPPHQPFLDMTDAAIFATKEDLPRIVAAIREPSRYREAVERVRGFRQRAEMIETARALLEELPDALARMGEELLIGAAECSYERFLELGPSERVDFLRAMDAPYEAALPDRVPSLWRTPIGLQFWRKHYELGDLVEDTVLESIHSVFVAICKRPPFLSELLSVSALGDGAAQVSSAIDAALAVRGRLFHEPEIVFLERGRIVSTPDFIRPERIAAFAADKARRRAEISRWGAETEIDDARQRPMISNLVELLLLPPDEILRRRAPIDLGALDFEAIQVPRRLIDRLTRLQTAAAAANIVLSDALVFDQPIPGPLDPRARFYEAQDFLPLNGDMFLLHASRALRKREPTAVEMVMMRSRLSSGGKRSVLRDLAERAGGRVMLSGLDAHPDALVEAEFAAFIASARDPLFGSIDTRNGYEVQRRMNERWWIWINAQMDALWLEIGGSIQALNQVIVQLDAPVASDAACSAPARGLPIATVSTVSFDVAGRVRIRCGEDLLVDQTGGILLRNALTGFYDLEPNGVWTRGGAGELRLLLEAEVPGQLVVEPEILLSYRVFGSNFLGSRRVTVALRSTVGHEGVAPVVIFEEQVDADADYVATLRCPPLEDGALLNLQVLISATTSPHVAGISADTRDLGVFLQRVAIVDRAAVPS